jgi:sugar (pentulose or hexulose) kinase
MDKAGTALLALDIGTTHCKAGLFILEGSELRVGEVSKQATSPRRSPTGYAYYDPEELWHTVLAAIRTVIRQAGSGQVQAVGIASMAETGLLVDRSTGQPRSPVLPWFDSVATRYREISGRLETEADRLDRFRRTGIRPSFKCSLGKILWLRSQDASLLKDSLWLSAADYVAFRLSGGLGTDFSLAGRTYAFRIDQKAWDEEWLDRFELSPDLFPPALPSGLPVGGCLPEFYPGAGLLEGTPVAVCGHDHVCAAFGAGAALPGQVFDSMGTAETLIGMVDQLELGEKAYASGLAYGCHVSRDRYYWLGGLSASGGSVEWLRAVLGDQPLSYPEMESLAAQSPPGPTGILYFPYLAGSGTPHPDPRVKGAFIGLEAGHTRADLVKAVMEGTAFEMEYIRRAAAGAIGEDQDLILAAGGGTRSRTWMQIKADVSGCPYQVSAMPEAALLGAALLAGTGAGIFPGEPSALDARPHLDIEVFSPDSDRHRAYLALFERGYLPLQSPLRAYGHQWDQAEYDISL